MDLSNDQSVIQAIRNKFGEGVFTEGVLDRDKLGAIVFNDKRKREVLNKIMHGKFFWKLIKEFFRLRFREKKEAIVLDVPLLYETKILEWI